MESTVFIDNLKCELDGLSNDKLAEFLEKDYFEVKLNDFYEQLPIDENLKEIGSKIEFKSKILGDISNINSKIKEEEKIIQKPKPLLFGKKSHEENIKNSLSKKNDLIKEKELKENELKDIEVFFENNCDLVSSFENRNDEVEKQKENDISHREHIEKIICSRVLGVNPMDDERNASEQGKIDFISENIVRYEKYLKKIKFKNSFDYVFLLAASKNLFDENFYVLDDKNYKYNVGSVIDEILISFYLRGESDDLYKTYKDDVRYHDIISQGQVSYMFNKNENIFNKVSYMINNNRFDELGEFELKLKFNGEYQGIKGSLKSIIRSYEKCIDISVKNKEEDNCSYYEDKINTIKTIPMLKFFLYEN